MIDVLSGKICHTHTVYDANKNDVCGQFLGDDRVWPVVENHVHIINGWGVTFELLLYICVHSAHIYTILSDWILKIC